MNKLGIGIIGTGVGIRTLLPGFRLLKNAEVIAISGSSPERTKQYATQNSIPVACEDYRSLCERKDIDLVCVASPNPFHFEHTLAALECEKNVLCEKPFTLTESDMEVLISKKQMSGKIGLIDHQLRFNPYLVKIRSIINDGIIGKPYFVQIHQQSLSFSDSQTKWSWNFDSKQGGGVKYAMCSHFADLLHYWFDSNIFNLSASLNPVFKDRKDLNGQSRQVSTSTFCSVSLELEHSISVSLSVTAGAFSTPRFDVKVYGDKGELYFDLDSKLRMYTVLEKGKEKLIDCTDVFQDERENKVSIFAGSFRYFAPKIVKAILNSDWTEIKDASTFEDARYTYNFLDAVGNASNNSILINPKEKEHKYV